MTMRVTHDLRAAAAWLREGQVVAFPTDTFYGLTVDPMNPAAVTALFELKGRPAEAALPFVAGDIRQVADFCGALSGPSARLAQHFWPGPLSLVLPAPRSIDPAVLGGGTSIAIRVPDHFIARALADIWGSPLPATSANRTGEPPAASAADLGALAGDPRVLVIDGGATPGGAPSTIVDARDRAVILVREGAVPWSRVLTFLQE